MVLVLDMFQLHLCFKWKLHCRLFYIFLVYLDLTCRSRVKYRINAAVFCHIFFTDLETNEFSTWIYCFIINTFLVLVFACVLTVLIMQKCAQLNMPVFYAFLGSEMEEMLCNHSSFRENLLPSGNIPVGIGPMASEIKLVVQYERLACRSILAMNP